MIHGVTCGHRRWLSKWEVRKAPVDPENLCSLIQVYRSPNSLISAVGRNDREQVTVPPPRGNRRPSCTAGKHKASKENSSVFHIQHVGLY